MQKKALPLLLVQKTSDGQLNYTSVKTMYSEAGEINTQSKMPWSNGLRPTALRALPDNPVPITLKDSCSVYPRFERYTTNLVGNIKNRVRRAFQLTRHIDQYVDNAFLIFNTTTFAIVFPGLKPMP